MKKWHWERANKLTTWTNVQQLDADRILLYRRQEDAGVDAGSYVLEQIVINRQNNQIESSIVGPNPNGTNWVSEFYVLRPDMTTKEPITIMDNYVHWTHGKGTGKVERFKKDCMLIMRAMQFNKWAAEE